MQCINVKVKRSFQGVLLVLIGAAFVSCNKYQSLTKQGHRVFIVKKEPVYCHDLGTFKGRGGSVEGSINILRNKIADKGGNRLYLTQHIELRTGMIFKRVHGNIVYGRGFRCKVR